MTAVVLALAASLFWAVGDLVAGLATRRSAALSVTLVSQVVGLAAAALVIVAAGRSWPGWHGLLPALLAGAALAAGTVCYLQALSIGTMSVVAPIAATCAVVSGRRGRRGRPSQQASGSTGD